MTDKKITQLTALTGANAVAGDQLAIVDVSDTTMSASGTTKKIALSELQAAPLSAGTANGVAYLNASKVLTTGSALTFDGTNLTVAATTPNAIINNASPSTLAGTVFQYLGTAFARDRASAGSGEYRHEIGLSAGFGGFHTYYVDNAERARIASGGELLVGLTTATGVAKLQVSGPIQTTGYTVATLPAGTVGMRTYVTDALAPSFSATVVGGGAVTIPVFYNGTNWIVA